MAKYFLLPLLLVFVLLSYSQTPKRSSNKILNDSNYAILIDSYMTASLLKKYNGEKTSLTKQELKIAEVVILAVIDSSNNQASKNKWNSDYRSIDLVKRNYKFQLIAVKNKKGEKIVYINAFCRAHNINWHKELVGVDDGGSCYFEMEVNLNKKSCINFYINGIG